MKAAVLFDMDGVIVDTEPLKFQAYREVFWHHLGTSIEDRRERLGLPEQAVMEFYLRTYHLEADVAVLVRQKRKAYLDILDQCELAATPGLMSLLASLQERQIPLGLGTSSDRDSTERILQRLALRETFAAVFTRDDVQQQKPAPEIYLKLADRLQAEPVQCMVIEDSPAGVSAGKKAGMVAVGITSGVSGENLVAAGADYIVPDFGEESRSRIVRLAESKLN